MTAGWGPVGYILGAVAWSWCFAAAGVWSRRLTWVSVAAWGVFAAATSVLFLPPEVRDQPGMIAAVSIGNAVAFVLLMAWLVEVAERVLRRSRATSEHGGHAPWVHPSRSPVGWAAGVMANCRLVRALGRLIPGAAMASDIRDVVYVSYVVPAAALERFVSPPLQLQRLGTNGAYALFTFLTYRHGHFGPTCFGPLRRMWPSPVQTNWRIHVWNPATGARGIQFLTTAITSTPHALATRLLADGVPMHVPARARVARDGAGAIRVEIDPGSGSAPDVHAALAPAAEPRLGEDWKECFGDWRGFLAYCVPQDRAMGVLPGGVVLRQEIDLGIPLEACRPLEGTVDSVAARAIVDEVEPVCFLVERVAFRFAGQIVDR